MNGAISDQEQQESPQATPNTPSLHFAAGFYWNRSRWNGAKSMPVVLELTNDAFIMYDRDDNQVFKVQPKIVQARFTSMGNVYLTVDGTRYFISGMGTPITPDFSVSQKERLQKVNTSSRLVRGAIGASGVETVALATNNLPIGAVGGVVGGAMGAVALYNDKKLLNALYTALQQAGAQMTSKRFSLVKLIFISTGITIIVLIIIFYAAAKFSGVSS